MAEANDMDVTVRGNMQVDVVQEPPELAALIVEFPS